MAAGEITSANIVGYQNNETGAYTSPMFSFTFMPVANSNVIKLGDVKATGMDSMDRIQIINPETLGADVMLGYYSDALAREEAWEEAEEDPEEYEKILPEFLANVGWWVNGMVGTAGMEANATNVVVGSGFLGLSAKQNNISFLCAGEAPTKATSYSTGAVTSPLFGNYLPASFYLKDLVVAGCDSMDLIQTINPETLNADAMYGYYSTEIAEEEAWEEAEEDPEEYAKILPEFLANVGWWVNGLVGGESADLVIVKPAEAFQGLSPAQNNLTFQYKGVLDLTPIVAE